MSKSNTFNEIEIRDYSELEKSFLKSSSILKKEYLDSLTEFHIQDVTNEFLSKEMSKYSGFYKITKLVFDEDESYLDKLATVIRAAHICNCSIVNIISSDGSTTDFWIGLVNKNNDTGLTGDLTKTLEGGIKGNFHGTIINPVSNTDVNDRLAGFNKYSVISAVSTVSSLRSEEEEISKYVQGIEKLVDALHGKSYSLLTIADPIQDKDVTVVEDSLETLYSQLSGFAKTEMSMNENSSVSNSEQFSKNYSKAIGTNTTVSQSHTNQTGWSQSDTVTESHSSNLGTVAVAVAGVAAVGLTVATGGIAAVAGAAALTAGAAAGIVGAGAITAAGSAVGGMIGTKTRGTSKQQGNNGSVSDTGTQAYGRNVQNTESEGSATGISKSLGTGRSMTFTVENRVVKSVLDSIDVQLERLKECASYGSFSACTYVLSRDISTNMLASSLFNALMTGEKTNIQLSKVNTWGVDDDSEDDVKRIISYLSKLTHPRFIDIDGTMEFTPASMVSGKELAVQLGFPKSSIQGVSVIYKVPFGRNLLRGTDLGRPLPIGKLYNLGELDKGDIELDLDSLTSHLFVTGSTGTGKSNVVYKMLEGISSVDKNIRFLVVEPVKGEYKHAFFKHPTIDVNVYGTNPQKTDLLKINPFSFPSDIHVLEHIDRLVEILNVCWPMYAAMPAILKKAVIKAYEKCGWDMTNSRPTTNEKIYPGFADVLESIEEILNSSAFSQDNKGDYTGALCTRVESLTTGINGQLFTGDELTYEQLFNSNVIIDLSRVGANETKSLIMGLLVLKLQEYNMSQSLEPNQPLRHITVLEEAHNLLKRTSTEQSSESSNLVGKSVEMLTNAIAEMRTYGEGFFIVDQSPSLLDRAVIRNTNTKIVLRLPEAEDREVVGKAMSLSDKQIYELSKLERGCAAVYQNDWEEAVLCQFDKYHKDYSRHERDKETFSYKGKAISLSQSEMKKEILRILLDLALDDDAKKEKIEFDVVRRMLMELPISHSVKLKIQKAVRRNEPLSMLEVSKIITRLYDCSKGIEMAVDSNDIEEWNNSIIYTVDPELLKMSPKYMNAFVWCLLVDQSEKQPEFKAYAEKWKECMKEAVR